MRIAAGILMMIVGLSSFATAQTYHERFGEVSVAVFGFLPFLTLGLTWIGGICAFRKKAYWWALSGAICSVFLGFFSPFFGLILSIMGILAVIFIIVRRSQFQG